MKTYIKPLSAWVVVGVFPLAVLLISFLFGCTHSSPVSLSAATVSGSPIVMPTNTLEAIPSTTPTATQLLTPTATLIASITPSPTGALETIHITSWLTLQLDYSSDVAAWSPDSKYVVFSDNNMAGLDDRTCLYNVETRQQVWQVNQGAGDMTFSPDGETIVDTSSFIQFWNAASGQIAGTYRPGNLTYHAAFVPDGSDLLIGWSRIDLGDESAYTEVGVWDDEHKRLNTIIEQEGDIKTITVSPDGKLLATAMALLPSPETGHRVFLWDLATRSKYCDFPGYDAIFSPVGNMLATAHEGNILLFNTVTCQPINSIHIADYISNFTFSSNGQILALAGNPWGVIWIHDVATGKLLYEIDELLDVTEVLAFSPNGHFLLANSLGKEPGSSHDVKRVLQIWRVTINSSK